MIYTIKYAKKGLKTLWLDQNGNKYVVSMYDIKMNETSLREEFERFDDADKRFLARCKELGIEPVNVEHDPYDFKFD